MKNKNKNKTQTRFNKTDYYLMGFGLGVGMSSTVFIYYYEKNKTSYINKIQSLENEISRLKNISKPKSQSPKKWKEILRVENDV